METFSSYCGPLGGGEDGTFISSDCRVSTLAVGVHCAFILTGAPCTAFLQKCYRHKSWHQYRFHSLRSVLTVVLLMLSLGWIAEGILVDYLSGTIRPYAHLLSTSLLVAILCSIIYYHAVEIRNLPLFLVLLLCYWTLSSVSYAAQLVSSYNRLERGAHFGGPRIFLQTATFTLFILLLLLECYLFLKVQVRTLSVTNFYL